MKKTIGRLWIFVLALGLTRELFAATPATLTLGNATAMTGSEVSLPLTFTASPDDGCSGFQFGLTLAPSVTYTSSTIGPVLTAASKQIFDNPAIPTVIVIGVSNNNAINSGLAGTVNLKIASNAAPGTYTIQLINLVATDPAGSALPITGVNASLTITTPIVASFTRNPVSGNAPLVVTFNGSYSTANPGSIVSWNWNFGDGTSTTGSTSILTHTYQSVGTYVSTLTVTDNLGNTAQTSLSTIVINLRSATLTAGNASGLPGTYVTFPVTFTPSPDLAAGVAGGFDIALPAGVTFSSATIGPVLTAAGDALFASAVSGQILVSFYGINQSTYGAGDMAYFTLSINPGTPAGTLPLTLSNLQFNDTQGTILIPTNPVAGAITVLGPPPGNLTLTKSASAAQAKPGDTITFTIQYQNSGGGVAANSVITDPVPAGTTSVAGSISNGGTLSGGVITWNLGTVAAGASGSVTFKVTVN